MNPIIQMQLDVSQSTSAKRRLQFHRRSQTRLRNLPKTQAVELPCEDDLSEVLISDLHRALEQTAGKPVPLGRHDTGLLYILIFVGVSIDWEVDDEDDRDPAEQKFTVSLTCGRGVQAKYFDCVSSHTRVPTEEDETAFFREVSEYALKVRPDLGPRLKEYFHDLPYVEPAFDQEAFHAQIVGHTKQFAADWIAAEHKRLVQSLSVEQDLAKAFALVTHYKDLKFPYWVHNQLDAAVRAANVPVVLRIAGITDNAAEIERLLDHQLSAIAKSESLALALGKCHDAQLEASKVLKARYQEDLEIFTNTY